MLEKEISLKGIKGMSEDEVKNRQEKYGLNKLPEKKPPSKISIFLSQLKNPLVYVLIGASAITVVIGHITDAAIIMFAVVINTILGFIQENKTSDSLSALKKFISDTTIVVRDGERKEIETKFLVPGDVVILGQGERIPADGIALEVNRFFSNEAILTGESVPIEKSDGNELFMGTTVYSGQALMKVTKTGPNTKMGAIAEKIQNIEEPTPFQKQVKKFSKQLLVVIGIIVTTVFIVGLIHKMSLSEIFITSVALAVSSIPEGLLVSLTVVLTIGMQKILKRKGLVRKLAAAETLGGVSVICVDKTGTLTEGKMEVSDFLGDKEFIAKQNILANDLDDPLIISSYDWAETIVDKETLTKHNRLDSIPFTSKEKFFMSLHNGDENKNIIFVNGAPEVLLQWVENITKEEKERILNELNELTNQGKRVLGYASKEVDKNKNKLEVSDAKSGLSWVGLLAFSDPIRNGLKEALEETTEAGIRVIVITGDYTNTSLYVMSKLGMNVSKEEYMTGEQLLKMSDEELNNVIGKIKLFARTTPDQKLRIVNALKAKKEVVAMIGDGVNDAPALHNSNIGIVVNEASDVAKESADLILLDSNFSTIVSAIEEGRIMFQNIRKIILYLLCDAFEEMLVILSAILFNLPLPITAVQILWVNLVSDGFPNLALSVDPKNGDIMKEKPRSADEPIVAKWMLVLMSFISIVAGITALFSFTYIYKKTGNEVLARSVTFITIGINSLVYVFSVRAPRTSVFKTRVFKNKWLNIAVIAGFALQAIPFLTPAFREFFRVEALPFGYWLRALGLSLFMFIVVEIFKHIYKPLIHHQD